MLEFTGERVVPGLVDSNLLNEHVARYRFAAQFAKHGLVLDAGCGSGYGSAELGKTARVIGFDFSEEAVRYSRASHGSPGVRFLQATCEALPFADCSFELVVAFEVIEHLGKWPLLLEEARRVLRSTGTLLVSTPNKAYYAETRAAAGPNPWHVHEFEYAEFRTALNAVFPHVRLWSQNHSEVIAFVPETPGPGILDSAADPRPESAHFFIAACSQSPIPEAAAFAWMPEVGNLLREREHHIELLEGEIRQKTEWLKEAESSHANLQRAHEDLLSELERQNKWADRLNAELKQTGEAIGSLQKELSETHEGYRKHVAGYEEKIAELEREAAARLDWVHDLESQIARGNREIERLNSERRNKLDELGLELQRLGQERRDFEERAALLSERQRLIAQSKWVRLGRRLNVGPVIEGE